MRVVIWLFAMYSGLCSAMTLAHPLRVVTLTNDSTEAMLALGITPVGATRSLVGNPWFPHITNQMTGVTVLGQELNPNIELIASLKPDLILGSGQKLARLKPILTLIAPTVFVKDNRRQWQQNFMTYARAVDEAVAGQQRLDCLNTQINTLKVALVQQPLKSVSVIRFNPGQVRMYQLDSFTGELFAALGLQRPPAQQVHAYGVSNFSRERIHELDADILFYFTDGTRRQQSTLQYRDTFMRDASWQQLNVVHQQQVYSMDDVTWNTANGVLAAEIALAQIPALFSLPVPPELNSCHLPAKP